MLEEALRDDKRNPSETALAMLSFIQYDLAAGGATAEVRFYKNLFGHLCERIFGTLDENLKHSGGWLSSQSQWNRTLAPIQGPMSSSKTSGRVSSSNLEADPVVRLLTTTTGSAKKDLTPPTLVEAISNESENRPSVGFSFPFTAFPASTQDACMTALELTLTNPTVGSGRHQQLMLSVTENDLRLFCGVLRKPQREQVGLLRLRQVQSQREALHSMQQPVQSSPLNQSGVGLPPRSFLSGLGPTPPTLASQAGGIHHGFKRDGDNSVYIILSMLEYYLVLFLRFPLAKQTPSLKQTSRLSSSSFHYQDSEPYGDTVYKYLFVRYYHHFLPHATAMDEGHSIILDASSPSNAQSELFLRLIILLWMESPMRLVPNSKMVQSLREEQLQKHQLQVSAIPLPPSSFASLDHSYDLTQAKDFAAPTNLVSTCLRKLVEHLLSDPSIPVAVHKYTTGQLLPNHALWVVQTPLYNYIRATFRHASLHTADQSFFKALNLWLLLLEPWNWSKSNRMGALKGSQQLSQTLSIPRYNDGSRYHPAWEPYIAANLCLYLVPFAIFLRRSRELDFSAHKFEASIRLVKRVFRVYSPAVVQVLKNTATASTGGSYKFASLVQEHLDRLGQFAPPLSTADRADGPLSLRSCQGDVHGLLEEVHMQHLKHVRDLDVFERFGAWLEGVFGMGVVQGQEKELDDLVKRAKGMVGLPDDYQVLPRPGDGGSAAPQLHERAASSARVGPLGGPLRTRDGELTAQGRAQVILGQVKCDPTEVRVAGDLMRGVVRPHEIDLLVAATVWASDWANAKLGLSGAPGCRINLRFLADYRNLLFVLLTCYLLLKWMF